jgi:hypothetical protein
MKKDFAKQPYNNDPLYFAKRDLLEWLSFWLGV